MASKSIRLGQLIAPFGPGSIYTDRKGIPHVVCGLDYWYKRWDAARGAMVPCEKPDEYERFEPRLARLLRVDRFRIPPDHRHLRRGSTPPENADLYIPAHRFPRWYRHSRTGRLRRFNLYSKRIDPAGEGGRWIPVRFVAVCSRGHLCEFPWKEWSLCECDGDGELYLTDFGGSELSSITVHCERCKRAGRGKDEKGRAGRTLHGVTQLRTDADIGGRTEFERAGIGCPGDRPWLGDHAREPCSEALVAALINQTNLYFPRTLSAILLPDLEERDKTVAAVREEIANDPKLAVWRLFWDMNDVDAAVHSVSAELARRGVAAPNEVVRKALRSVFEPSFDNSNDPRPSQPESELVGFRRAEYNVLRKEVNDPERIPDLRVIPVAVPELLRKWIGRVHLVERLKETRVFYGFDRLAPSPSPLADMPHFAMRQLFLRPPTERGQTWLPAVEVFGEGVFLELREEAILEWQESNARWLERRLSTAYVERIITQSLTLPPLGTTNILTWASRYLLIHSLAHMLINQMVFECGYSTASLRERLYVSADRAAPMAGILIYTAAGDSEGTLGGLVTLGRPERLGAVFQRALSRASWCSADPVCSENLGGQGALLANLAACHSCILLPETSCETLNNGLDRAMVIGTPRERERGAMIELLEHVYATA